MKRLTIEDYKDDRNDTRKFEFRNENKIKLSLDKFIITILIKKVKYSPEQIENRN